MNKKGLIALTVLLCCALLLACGQTAATQTATTQQTSSQTTTTQQAQENITFVAADKTNWDKEITIGDYAYTLAVELKADGTVELNATCVGKPQAESNTGMGGSGGTEEETAPAEPEPEMTASEKEAQNFSLSGSWTKEEGFGYTITIDGYTTKTNFDKASSRHIFHAEVKNSGLIEFQGKDTAFRKELAADYQDFEVRDAQYIFEGTGTTATGNASSTKVYLEKDGTANSLVQSGSSPTYTRGTWSENADKSLTVNLGGEKTADYCDIAGKEGYRLVYNSNTMYCSVSGAAVEYSGEDFDGKVVKTLQCSQQDYTVELTEKGTANVMKGAEKSSAGKYVEEGDTLKITIDGTEYVSADGLITLEFSSGDGSCASSETRTFAVDGSVPEATEEPAAEGDAAATESSSGGDEAAAEGGEEAAPAEGGEEAAPAEGAEGEPSSEGGESSSGGGEAPAAE